MPPRVKQGAPEWLIELATAYSGKKVGDSGALVETGLAADALEKLRDKIAALPANDPLAAWAQWFLANPETRPFAPGFSR